MNRPITNTTAPIATANAAIRRLRVAISFRSGDGTSTVVCVRCAIRPKAVCIPVANTSALASPLVTRRARQQDVPAPQQVGLGRRSSVSRHRTRLAGHRGVVDANAESLDEPAVSGHVIPGGQEDDIAGNDVVGRDHDHGIITQCPDLMRKQTLQRGHRFFGPVLLPEREGAVDHDHRDDGDRERRHALAGHPSVRDQRQQGREPQEDGEEVRELADESNDERCPLEDARCG